MRRSFMGIVLAAVMELSQSAGYAAELWTFYFVPDWSRPYYQECYGDCFIYGTGADLAGSFSIVLDWEALTGRLHRIDDRLVNIASIHGGPNGPQFVPANPSYYDHGLYTGWSSPEFGTGSFIFDPSVNMWQVAAGGQIPLPEGGFRSGTPYGITFNRANAWLSLQMPSVPFISVTNAPAVLGDIRIAGDYNDDSRVDASDYVLWRKLTSKPGEYDLWRTYFAGGAAGTGGESAPEPGVGWLVAVGVVAALARRRRRGRC